MHNMIFDDSEVNSFIDLCVHSDVSVLTAEPVIMCTGALGFI